jgi:hypothetical protein
MSLLTKNDCINAIALAKRAEVARSYLLDIIEDHKKDLLDQFIGIQVDFDEDFVELLPIKRRFDVLITLKDMIDSHINNGKVAEKMISKFDK